MQQWYVAANWHHCALDGCLSTRRAYACMCREEVGVMKHPVETSFFMTVLVGTILTSASK